MRPINREELLWELSAGEERAGQTSPIDSLLQRYREGGLAAEEARQVERMLASDPRARARLAELAGQQLSEPPSELRERFLGLATAPSRPAWRRRAVQALAASLFVAFGALLHSALSPSTEIPRDLSFSLSAKESVSRVRSSSDAPSSNEPLYEVRASDTIELWMTPEVDYAEELQLTYGIYVREGNRLLRNSDLRIERDGGGARLYIGAEDLLGTRPGEYEVFVTVGTCAPDSIPLKGDGALTALREGRQRLAFSQSVKLIPESSEGETTPDLEG